MVDVAIPEVVAEIVELPRSTGRWAGWDSGWFLRVAPKTADTIEQWPQNPSVIPFHPGFSKFPYCCIASPNVGWDFIPQLIIHQG